MSLKPDVNVQGPLYLNGQQLAHSSSRDVSVAEPEAERTPTRRSTRDTTDDLPMHIALYPY